MGSFSIRNVSGLRGEVFLPGDKSIAHRCIIAASLSRGRVVIRNFPANNDCLSTISVFKKLGIKIKQRPGEIIVFGRGLRGLEKFPYPIYAGESGTTFRLMLGVLAGQNFQAKLIAGRSLSRRPMLRVNKPLRMMGAVIKGFKVQGLGAEQEEYPPIIIKGGSLKGITYKMPVASAQVKSAILLAGLNAQGRTRVIEPLETRDHTERILKLFKAGIIIKKNTVIINKQKELRSPFSVYIPGDISSAAFFIVAGLISPGSRIVIKNVGLNPTRTGALKVLKKMGAKIQVSLARSRGTGFEPMGNIIVKSSKLKGVKVKSKEIPSLIDELPILMVAACFAKGKTVLKGVAELRVKETDRIRSMRDNLVKMGADIQVRKSASSESVVINGANVLKGARVKSFGDHRTAMSMIIAGLAAGGCTKIDDISCINKSFPGFLAVLNKLK